MRPNKYRAWDKKWKRWIDPKDICVYGDGTADFVRRAENGDKIEIVELRTGEIELMQSTGKKDKSNVEIDDGDKTNRGIVRWSDKFSSWLCGDFFLWAAIGDGELEVIGNIHQPKEKENGS